MSTESLKRTGPVGELTRREFLQRGVAGAAGFWFAQQVGLPRAFAAPANPSPIPAKARSVIQVWMWGGPSHLDTFDPKPEAGNDYCGPFKSPIATKAGDVRICELLPLLAAQGDKFSLIRSMTHGHNGHETAAYAVQTGRPPGEKIVYPSLGAVVSLFKGYDAGYRGLVPPYVVLTELQGRFSEVGFLGSRYRPFATGGDPAQSRFNVEGVVAEGVSEERQRNRRALLHNLNTLEHALPSNPQLAVSAKAEEEAYELILGSEGKVFDLSQEKDEVRERYGRNTFGQSCLAARRLVERGVPYVTVNSGGWDTHKQHFQAMRRRLPQLDQGLATLLQDLADRSLLGSTIVWCCGEFGRTPKIQWEPPWSGGRGHYGQVFSALVAGGGFRGGQVVGASDAKGEHVQERPVYPCDLLASIYQLLGISSEARLPHPQGLDVRAIPTAAENVKRGGMLKEIM